MHLRTGQRLLHVNCMTAQGPSVLFICTYFAYVVFKNLGAVRTFRQAVHVWAPVHPSFLTLPTLGKRFGQVQKFVKILFTAYVRERA